MPDSKVIKMKLPSDLRRVAFTSTRDSQLVIEKDNGSQPSTDNAPVDSQASTAEHGVPGPTSAHLRDPSGSDLDATAAAATAPIAAPSVGQDQGAQQVGQDPPAAADDVDSSYHENMLLNPRKVVRKKSRSNMATEGAATPTCGNALNAAVSSDNDSDDFITQPEARKKDARTTRSSAARAAASNVKVDPKGKVPPKGKAKPKAKPSTNVKAGPKGKLPRAEVQDDIMEIEINYSTIRFSPALIPEIAIELWRFIEESAFNLGIRKVA